jgi:hypothetical protein
MWGMWCGGCASDLEPDRFYAGQRWCKGCLSRASGEALGRRRARNKRFLLDHLAVHPCEACGESDPVVLEFDHRGDKLGHLSALAHEGVTLERLAAEMAKCAVLCANCHRRRSRQAWRQKRTGETVGAGRARRTRNVVYVRACLLAAGCIDCGERDPDVLEFDHQGPKRSAVSVLAWNECGLDTLDHEMDGCDVRCASCHRRRTAMEGRHYRYVALTQPL